MSTFITPSLEWADQKGRCLFKARRRWSRGAMTFEFHVPSGELWRVYSKSPYHRMRRAYHWETLQSIQRDYHDCTPILPKWLKVADGL